jgi:hypothetical protein
MFRLILQRLFEKKIKQAKDKTWREFTEQTDERTIWQIKKYLTTTPTQPFIPTQVDNHAANNGQKAERLGAAFFPEPPDDDTSDRSPHFLRYIPTNTE